jgi:cytosine/adenosine deaminase-related metal-dependent hydrolase
MSTVKVQTYTARWLFPIDAAPLERGTITVRGDTIAAVELFGARTPDVDLGNVAILPGFVNAHTHLDLTGAVACRPPGAHASGSLDFVEWLRSVIAFRRTRTPAQVRVDIAAGLTDCLRFGTTLIGDISADGASWELILRRSCRAVVFRELIGLTNEGWRRAWDAVESWKLEDVCARQVQPGLSPHAPYSVNKSLYELTNIDTRPVATHLAETKKELELLLSHTGPFVDFLQEMNVWNPSGLIPDVAYLPRFHRGLFIHCNYLDPATPFRPTQTVVVCPRTHYAFGHDRHPFPEFLKRGVRVALGTDSLASNPDLDILAEARHLREHYPEVEPATLLRMLTLNGAEALGFGDITGSLTPGKSADLVVVPLPHDEGDPQDLVLESTLPVCDVMFQGEWVQANVSGGVPA